jgi:hypothetical protein
MRRLRYICGGEEGRDANGSATEVSIVGITPVVGTDGIGLPGGGAPFTNWSILFDMVRNEFQRSAVAMALSSCCGWVHFGFSGGAAE